MADETRGELSAEELEAQSGHQLPDREVMSLITPDAEGRLAMDVVESGGTPPPNYDLGPPPITE